MLGSPVTASDENFANGVANLLTAPGATEALRITGAPPEWEVRQGTALQCMRRCRADVLLKPGRIHLPQPMVDLLAAAGNAEPPAVAATCVHMERGPPACLVHLVCRPRSRATSCATTPSRRA